MEMIFAAILGCILSFLCGAGVVYGGVLFSEKPREPAEIEEDAEMNEQWLKLLSYDGNRLED